MADQNALSDQRLARKSSIRHSALKPLRFGNYSSAVWLNLIAGWLYVAAFFFIYRSYISIEWSYVLFYYRPMTLFEWAFIVLSVSIASLFLPKKIHSPSSMILWLLYSFIVVPANIITFMIGEYSSIYYIPSLLAMTFIICVGGHLNNKKSTTNAADHNLPSLNMVIIAISVFILLSIILYLYFYEILAFSDIDDIYYQRFIASDIGGGLIGYLRSYYTYVFSPLLIAIGLLSRRFVYLIGFGVLGTILVYMIDASKIALIIPLVMIVFHIVLKYVGDKTYIFTMGLAALTLICSMLTSQIALVKLAADLLVLRSIAIPAQTFALYADLFAGRDYTWWSNVRGISFFVPPPDSFAADPHWPALGQIVGARYYGFQSSVNSNANLFVGEGVAAGGAIGVLAIGIAFLLFLEILDRSAVGWNRRFTIIATLPLGLSLTNTHLSTLLLSFGGLFWLLLFRYYKPA